MLLLNGGVIAFKLGQKGDYHTGRVYKKNVDLGSKVKVTSEVQIHPQKYDTNEHNAPQGAALGLVKSSTVTN